MPTIIINIKLLFYIDDEKCSREGLDCMSKNMYQYLVTVRLITGMHFQTPEHYCITCNLSLSLFSLLLYCRFWIYPNGYPVLRNSWGGFPLPSSQFVIAYCDQSFPSPRHCLSAAPSRCYPLVHSRGHSPIHNLGTRMVAVVPQPSANLSHQQTPPTCNTVTTLKNIRFLQLH